MLKLNSENLLAEFVAHYPSEFQFLILARRILFYYGLTLAIEVIGKIKHAFLCCLLGIRIDEMWLGPLSRVHSNESCHLLII